jgi:catechol 2,3-dioxygenase-like lactoylglutathione lyase family enzyme
VHVGTVVMSIYDMRRAVAFWTAALDYVPRDGEVDGRFTVLVPASGPGVGLSLQASTSVPGDVPHVHLDLYSDDQAGEVERLVGLGAERVDWPDYPADADFVVLADPDGNRFCIIDTTREL